VIQPATDLNLVRLLQLASPALPVGAYAYSQGLEWAVAAGWVSDAASLAQWLDDQLRFSFGAVDVPIFARLYDAARTADDTAQLAWSRELIARRETRELIVDDCDRGRALAKLLDELGVSAARAWLTRGDTPFAALMAVAAAAWNIALAPAAQALAWSWLESQVVAGVKLIPLGQMAGQQVLLDLAGRIPAMCEEALARSDDDIGGTLPIVAVASSLHETQYTRLFRS